VTTTAIQPTGAGEAFQRLDPYKLGGVSEAPRAVPLGIISAGYRAEGRDGQRGLPRATRPDDAQQIHLHDPMNTAPELRRILEANHWNHLTIAFPLDDPRLFISQIFTRYSATRLEIYGDALSVTYIDNRPQTMEANHGQPLHRVFPSGSAEYERLVRTCKADTRIAFCLAEWTDEGSQVIFPDGLGTYAIRTTSRHSVRNILAKIAETAQYTHGMIAGLPFTLRIVHRPNVTGPDGTQRQVPLWSITTKPPSGISLSSRTFRQIATAALREGRQLMLPSPATPTLEELERDGEAEDIDVDEPNDEQMLALESGARADQAHWTRTWHAMARGLTWRQPTTGRLYKLDEDDGRMAFLTEFTGGKTGSLSAFLQTATDEQATELLAALGTHRTQMSSAKYEEIFGDDSTSRAAPVRPATRAADEQPTADDTSKSEEGGSTAF
jgi:hypothetical protein